MPFADTTIPSIQISLLESYLKKRGINASSSHMYLFAANFYGLKNYSYLINPPNDPYTSQMVYTKYVFPDHWNENYEIIKNYYNSTISIDTETTDCLTFEDYVERTDSFYNWIINQQVWKDYDIIGFSLNYGQFLPSLSIAKILKEQHPDKTIVFGGSTTINELGLKILTIFDFIDYIVTGDGEEALYQLATESNNIQNIPGLIYRTDNGGCINQHDAPINMNTLPHVDYSSFYNEIQYCSEEIQQYYHLNGRLPIEISRGCWWNKCTFCNQQAYHTCYREKTVDHFIEELTYLSETYKMLSFQIIGSTLPHNNYQELCEKIIQLKKDFSIYAEARADRLQSSDYYYLKKAGFKTIQTGIETFSQNYIKKMNKGARVIDNIAALKFCKEYGIKNDYNFIIHFPNEELEDFEETKQTISSFKQYLDPPRISSFVVGYESPIYQNLEEFNIERLIYKNSDKIMFPKHILQKNFQFFYNYIKKNKTISNDWNLLIDEWNNDRNYLINQSIQSDRLIDTLIFYYIDGGTFIKIYDKRNMKDINIFILNEREREIFLSCTNIIHYNNLKIKFDMLPEIELQEILDDLVENKIIYHENNSYFSLPLSLSNFLGFHPDRNTVEAIGEPFPITIA